MWTDIEKKWKQNTVAEKLSWLRPLPLNAVPTDMDLVQGQILLKEPKRPRSKRAHSVENEMWSDKTKTECANNLVQETRMTQAMNASVRSKRPTVFLILEQRPNLFKSKIQELSAANLMLIRLQVTNLTRWP